MLGIQDPYVLLAYLLCVASTLLCVIYGLATWNRGEIAASAQDVRWGEEEKKVEEEL